MYSMKFVKDLQYLGFVHKSAHMPIKNSNENHMINSIHVFALSISNYGKEINCTYF